MGLPNLKILNGDFWRRVCIAVYAAVEAGVVHSDIFAFNTTAFLSLSLILLNGYDFSWAGSSASE